MKQIKIAVIGEGAVGKTSLLTTYLTNAFPDEYLPHMLYDCSKEIYINDNKVNLIMLDYQFCDLSLKQDKLLFEGTQIFLICFSIDYIYSLKKVKKSWIPDKKAEFPDVPFILVGMKSDLRDKDNSNNYQNNFYKEDLISKETAENMAKKTGAVCYIECSSKNSININYLFERAIEIVYNQQTYNDDDNDDKSCCIIY